TGRARWPATPRTAGRRACGRGAGGHDARARLVPGGRTGARGPAPPGRRASAGGRPLPRPALAAGRRPVGALATPDRDRPGRVVTVPPAAPGVEGDRVVTVGTAGGLAAGGATGAGGAIRHAHEDMSKDAQAAQRRRRVPVAAAVT